MTVALKLKPNPTFTAKVAIPVPGRDPIKVEFTFRHRTVDELQKLLAKDERTDLDYVLECCSGWELTDEFNRKNVGALLQNYHGAAGAIGGTYIAELTGHAILTPESVKE